MGKEQKEYAMAFFDAQNLFRHAKAAFGYHHPNFDPKKLHNAVCDHFGWTPNLTRFYTGVPEAQKSQMWSQYWNNRVIALKRACVSVTTRKLRYHSEIVEPEDGSQKKIETSHEKGIDVRIALDIVRACCA